jgi:competence protein ComEC
MRLGQKEFWLIFLALFLPLYFLRLYSIPAYQIPEGRKIKVRGKIDQQPYLKGSQQVIMTGPFLIRTSRFPGFFYGQEIEVIGKFRKQVINRFWTRYLAYFPTIRLIKGEGSNDQRFNWRQVLLNIRGQLAVQVEELFPEPQASLLLGIIFGVKRQMSQEFWQNLQETGTLHIVVASGQNVAMVARFLIGILVLVVERRKAIWLALLGVAIYVLMVGAEAPVVRAGIMVGVGFLAQFFGREEKATIALFVAASIMLLVSPLVLFDVGFQLSFMATAGLIWVYPIIREKCEATNFSLFSFPVFGEALVTTVAAQLAVMPIILVNFGQISWLSPAINGIVLWVVPLIMVLGSATTVLALVIRPLAQVLSWFVWLLLTYFVKMIEWSGSIPWASWKVGKTLEWWVVGYYLVLIWVIVRWHRGGRRCPSRSL